MTVCCQPEESSLAVVGRKWGCIDDLLSGDVLTTSIDQVSRNSNTIRRSCWVGAGDTLAHDVAR
jgi:hypothetical protein